MEQSDLHGRRLDDELERESEPLTHGVPTESRVDDEIDLTGPPVTADDTSPAPSVDAPSLEEARARSELARHLRPSVFPAVPAAIVECAREEHAPDELLDRLAALPPGTYVNVAQVWEALGGHREHRPHLATPEEAGEATIAEETEEEVEEVSPAIPLPRARERFGFRFDPWYRWAAIPFGIHPDHTYVVIDRGTEPAQLTVRFGPWLVATTLANVTAATITGPYALVKTIGPPHVSLVDAGLTFATNAERGVCIEFRDSVVGLDPLHLLHHPSVTVTVDDPDALAGAIEGAIEGAIDDASNTGVNGAGARRD